MFEPNVLVLDSHNCEFSVKSWSIKYGTEANKFIAMIFQGVKFINFNKMTYTDLNDREFQLKLNLAKQPPEHYKNRDSVKSTFYLHNDSMRLVHFTKANGKRISYFSIWFEDGSMVTYWWYVRHYHSFNLSTWKV